MNIGAKRPIKLGFPYSLYFKQLFSKDTYVRFINPVSFWRRYKIDRLESCHELNMVQYLENCYRIEWRPSRSFKFESNTDYTNALTYALIEQVDSNTIISQPTIRLKYRGVTYQIRDLTKINIDCVKIDSSVVEPNSIEQPSNRHSAEIRERRNN